MKKVAVLMLSLLLVFSVVCGSLAESEINIQKVSEENISFTAFKGSHTVMGTQINDWGETRTAQLMAEKTGVTLEFITPILGEEANKMTLLISSDDLPDFIYGPDGLYNGGSEAMLEDGLIIDLAPYLDLMPNFKASLEESELRQAEIFTDDGRIPSLPIFFENDDESEVFVGILIRKDLLEQVGMDVPVTYDDWYNVLTAFKNECGISKPFSCGPEMWGQNNMWSSGFGFGYMDYFGTNIPFYQVDGKVRYAPLDDTEAFRAYMEMMAKWYREGLIDPDFQTVTDVNAQIGTYSSPECGACLTAYSLAPVLASIGSATRPDFEYVCAPIPVLEKGQTTHMYAATNRMSRHALSITKDCENVELAVKYWDQYYTKDVSNMLCWGFEGDTYQVDANGVKTWTEKMTNDPNYNLISMRYATLGSDTPGVTDVHAAEVETFSQAANQLYRSHGDNLWRISTSVSLTEDERSEYNSIMTDINTFMEETGIQFMTGKRSFDTFDAFIEQINGMNVQAAMSIYQNALDRYNTR